MREPSDSGAGQQTGGADLDISATLTAGKNAVVLFVVNDGPKDINQLLDLSAFGVGGQEIAVWTLTDRKRAGQPDITNSFGEPERVSPVKSKFQAGSSRINYRFPALSLTVMRWQVAK